MQLNQWECRAVAPGTVTDPASLDALDALTGDWVAMSVPGTAASAVALAASGGSLPPGAPRLGDDADQWDWWFRCTVALDDLWPDPGRGVARLRFDGIATLGEVWWNRELVLETDNMFRAYDVEVPLVGNSNGAAGGSSGSGVAELLVRCASVQAAVRSMKGRPRWRTDLVADQQLRRIRTTLFGRQPGWTGTRAPVGPWRPVELTPIGARDLRRVWLDATVVDSGAPVRGRAGGTVGGRVEVAIEFDEPVSGAAQVHCGGATAALVPDALVPEARIPDALLPDTLVLESGQSARWVATLDLDEVERWWPATHGAQPLYPVTLEWADSLVDSPTGNPPTAIPNGDAIELGSVGFRTIDLGPADAPTLSVNDQTVFLRGVCWTPVDSLSFAPSVDDVRAALTRFRNAGMNLIRVVGTAVYEDEQFHQLCDELGLMVWQDLMFARMDYPFDDEAFAANVAAELVDVAERLRSHPSTAVLCGGTEIAQQVAMLGRDIDPATLVGPQVESQIRALLPGVAFVDGTPTGGTHPFTVDVGFAHYFGVGGYRRPLSDARTSGVRFASECLAFSHVPNDEAVDEVLAGGHAVGDPTWAAGVPRDRATPWDFEDVRDHYVRLLYGVDTVALRSTDPEWYLDLGRAAGSKVLTTVLAEWRRPNSGCGGAIILEGGDTRPGAGAGTVDDRGRLKPAYFGLARALAPVALTVVDEGLNGLDVWAYNDSPVPLDGTLVVEAFSADALVATASAPLEVQPHSAQRVRAEEVLGTFIDVTDAFRFGPSPIAGVVARWIPQGADGERAGVDGGDSGGDFGATWARASYTPQRRAPITRTDLGLSAISRQIADDLYEIDVSARRYAEFVLVECRGGVVTDSGFDVEPGGTVTVTASTDGPLRARVRALTSDRSIPVVPAPES